MPAAAAPALELPEAASLNKIHTKPHLLWARRRCCSVCTALLAKLGQEQCAAVQVP